MRINSLFEHDASMKRQAEMAESNMNGNGTFEDIPEHETVSQSKTASQGSSSKPPAQRHRASIACASCRDRRIRVS